MLRQPDMADRLRAAALAHVNTDTEYLLSSNIGCALHLSAGLRANGHSIEAIHPIDLLARALQPDPTQ
ncbi:hypothetical protein [Alkalilimnicola ehrlichii]